MAAAFCPAHITGFFRADIGDTPQTTGSVGAGFSINKGITTRVSLQDKDPPTGIAKYVVERFLEIVGNRDTPVDVQHEIDVPLGYGMGSSGALALSTALALNVALDANLDRAALVGLAHAAEIHHHSGLGDVVAAHVGGFEVRTKAGGPSHGIVQNLSVGDPTILIVCLAQTWFSYQQVN